MCAGLPAHAAGRPEGEAGDDLGTNNKSIQEGLFATLFTLTKNRAMDQSLRIAGLRVVLEFLQVHAWRAGASSCALHACLAQQSCGIRSVPRKRLQHSQKPVCAGLLPVLTNTLPMCVLAAVLQDHIQLFVPLDYRQRGRVSWHLLQTSACFRCHQAPEALGTFQSCATTHMALHDAGFSRPSSGS